MDEKNNKKEVALRKAGVTRELTYSTLFKHLVAKKEIEKIDEYGVKTVVVVDDYQTQEKAMEKAIRVFGDVKPDAAVVVNNSQNKIIIIRAAIPAVPSVIDASPAQDLSR